MHFSPRGSAMALLLALAACLAAPARACMMSAPFELSDMRQADIAFSGRLLEYRVVSPGRPNSLDDYALLKVRVDRAFKGDAKGDVELYWWNSTFGMPEDLDRSAPVLIAAVRSDRRALPLRGPSATTFPTRRPDLLQVLQAPCSSPFILDYSRADANHVRAILNGATISDPERILPPVKWERRKP